MDRIGKRLALGLALSLFAVACAAPTIPNDSTEDPNASDSDITGTKTPKKTTTPSKSTTTTPGGSTTTPPSTTPTPSPTPTPTPTPAPNNCGGQTGEACFTCCDQLSGGELAKADDAFGQCACGGGACSSVCANNFCTGAAPSAACDSCLTNTCDPQASALCTSAACQAGSQCAQQCQ